MKSNGAYLRGLQQVRVSKDFLLAKLLENRDEHRKLFEEALDGWHEEVIKALETQIERVKADKKYNPSWHIPMPEDHTCEYDKMIDLVRASLDDEFELALHEFNCYVRDDWGWKADFLMTALNYTNKKGE
jgi:hypothetical protein